jgi:hypothetical protein
MTQDRGKQVKWDECLNQGRGSKDGKLGMRDTHRIRRVHEDCYGKGHPLEDMKYYACFKG